MEAKEWDIFVSHAAEDKATVARPLAAALRRAGARVWLDEQELTIGDSLSEKIDEGLAHSQFGVVILSPAFFAKHWPRRNTVYLRLRMMTASWGLLAGRGQLWWLAFLTA
jgi:TIR domain-containing protein